MTELTKHEKVANIVAFLSIIFGEDEEAFKKIMEFHPDYIIEKFERYVLDNRIANNWGLNPVLRKNIFQIYVDKWELQLND